MEIRGMSDNEIDEINAEIREVNERNRLEREVIKKAMARHHAETDYWEATARGRGAAEEGLLQQANCDLRVATLALAEFESQLQVKK